MNTQDEHIAQFEAELAHDRDTHFQNAAELLANKLDDYGKGWHGPIIDEVIVQFLYDFAVHVIHHTPFTPKHPSERYISECIPDLVEWPEKQSE